MNQLERPETVAEPEALPNAPAAPQAEDAVDPTAPAPERPPLASARPPPPRRLRLASLREARAELARRTPRQRQDIALARAAKELADAALDTREPLPPGTTVPLAIGLYCDSIFWALSAATPGDGPPTPDQALDGPASSLLLEAAGSLEARVTVREMLTQPFASWTRRQSPEQEEVVRVLGETSRKLVERLTVADRTARFGVALRIGLTLLGAALTSLLLYQLSLWFRGPDYALGKPWRASSSAFTCQPELTTCGGATTAIFFHTADQQRPWLEIDLGATIAFSQVVVHNRADCCLERAVPLLIEASTDRKHWVQVAHRDDPFDVWHARFKPHSGRYVRLTVERRSILHLERVEVRR